jgi:hypothetical protein
VQGGLRAKPSAASDADVLRLGSSGADVQALQRQLNALGESLLASGQFGPRTLEAVRRFQVVRGIKPADGIVDAGTRKALDELSKQADAKNLLAAPKAADWFDVSSQKVLPKQEAPADSVQLVLNDGRNLSVEEATGEAREAYNRVKNDPHGPRDAAVMDLNRELLQRSRKGFYTAEDRQLIARLLKTVFAALGLADVMAITGGEKRPAVRVEGYV